MQNATPTDPELSALAQMIIDRWPDHIKDVPHNLWMYHPSSVMLTVEDGLILFGEALLMPSLECDETCQCHMKATKVMLRHCCMPRMSSADKD